MNQAFQGGLAGGGGCGVRWSDVPADEESDGSVDWVQLANLFVMNRGLLIALDGGESPVQLSLPARDLADDMFGNVVTSDGVKRPFVRGHVDLKPDPTFHVRGNATDRSVKVRQRTVVYAYLGLAVAE